DQARAVLHQPMPDEAQFCLHARPLPIKPGIGVGRAAMGFIGPLLAPEVSRRVAAAASRSTVCRPVLWLETLHRGPGLDHRTDNRKMPASKQPPAPGSQQYGGQNFGGNVSRQ